MVKISIEEIEEMTARRKYINSLDLFDIVWTKNGIELDIPEDVIEDFWPRGLNNIDFITTGYYKKYEGN
jgi:hypothetical protein